MSLLTHAGAHVNDKYTTACAIAYVKLRRLSATRRRSSAGREEGPAEADSGDYSEEHAMDVEGGDTSGNEEPQDLKCMKRLDLMPEKINAHVGLAAVVPHERQIGNGIDEGTSFVEGSVEEPIASTSQGTGAVTPAPTAEITADDRYAEPIASTSQGTGAVTPAPEEEIMADDRYLDGPLSDVAKLLSEMNQRPCVNCATRLLNEYSGKALPFDEVDNMVRGQSDEVWTFVDSYLVEFSRECCTWDLM
ncbi:hypothetical protein Y032_0094g2765 [Ancylostoma ceylanicum]|uniref:Uncharacterized protein n=1 Tax=Ancylostoma ceylanicum TaxID=53326 RepID=A0A016TL93_9BILA|nr:hypothetical protein Y032_0094g2765 [Ancylostoma ceylanicum]